MGAFGKGVYKKFQLWWNQTKWPKFILLIDYNLSDVVTSEYWIHRRSFITLIMPYQLKSITMMRNLEYGYNKGLDKRKYLKGRSNTTIYHQLEHRICYLYVKIFWDEDIQQRRGRWNILSSVPSLSLNFNHNHRSKSFGPKHSSFSKSFLNYIVTYVPNYQNDAKENGL